MSVDPLAGVAATARLTMYGLSFVLSYQLFNDSAQARSALAILGTSMTCYAVYGLFAYVFTPDTLLWMRKWAYVGDLTSTFVNRNSFGTYAGIGLLANYAWLRRVTEQVHSSSRPLRLRIADFLVTLTRRAPLPLVGVGSTSAALFLTHSRGAFIATSAALVFTVIMECLTRSRASTLQRLLVALAIGAVLGMLYASGEVTLNRLIGTDLLAEERLQVYSATRVGIEARPYLGHGLGSFPAAFPMYVTTPKLVGYTRAHNDYLEAAFELGIPAAVVLVGCLTLIALCCLRAVLTPRRQTAMPMLGIGASILVGVHSFTDFSLQIPAVALTYAAILGLSAADRRKRRFQAT